jgi:integrase
MSAAPHQLGHEGPSLVNPTPDVPVFPADRARPGTRESDLPRFGELRWQLAALDHGASGRSQAVNWEGVPVSLRAGLMRAGWAVINLPTPEILLHRSGSSTRPRLSPGSLKRTFSAWRGLARWLAQHQVTCLDQVDRSLLEKYLQFLAERGLTRGPVTTEMFAITRLWAYAPFLLPADRITMPPWDEPGAEPGDVPGAPAGGAGENTTTPVHPAVMSPLLVAALRTVTDFAPDILAAWRDARSLSGRIPPAPRPGGRADIRAYLQRLRDTGQPLPVFTGHQTGALARAHQVTQAGKAGPGRPLAHNRFIAGTLGVTAVQVTALLAAEPDVLEGVRSGAGAPLATPVTAQVGGRSWRDAIDVEDVMDLAVHLAAAALLTVAYLSGMRPQEVLNLERGCCTAQRREDGTVRYLITGRHFKGVTGEDGNTIPGGQTRSQPWTVIEPVHRAITVLEELTEGRLLFPRRFSKAAKPRAYLGDAMSVITANARIARFAAWANTLAAEHRREHEMIPADPGGAVTMRRFRRTAAWFINRQPGGRIALGIQYGHLRATFGESYGGRSRVDMLQILDLEQALATADTLTEAAGRLGDGEGVSGPAAGRYIAAAREFQATYAAGFASKRQHRALLGNPRLQVFDPPQALLTCNYDPLKALCDPNRGKPGGQPQRTPSQDRCHSACANISRTDTHVERIRAEAGRIEAEIADGLVPLPIQQRLRQRQATLNEIIVRHQATRIHPYSPEDPSDRDPGE